MVTVHNDIIKLSNTYYYKVPVYTVEVVISNQTELGAGKREGDWPTFFW